MYRSVESISLHASFFCLFIYLAHGYAFAQAKRKPSQFNECIKTNYQFFSYVKTNDWIKKVLLTQSRSKQVNPVGGSAARSGY